MINRLLRGATVLVALFLAVSVMTSFTSGSSKAVVADPEPPDITITFMGLMVFDQATVGAVSPVVTRLHSGADNHKVTISVTGPEFEHGIVWGSDLPRGMNLSFDKADGTHILPLTAKWAAPTPFDIKTLHPPRGDLTKVPDAFGPTITFSAGTFTGTEPSIVDFVNFFSAVRNQSIPTMVEAQITLEAGQIGLLSGGGLDPFPLAKPEAGQPKWQILVKNEPDFSHKCGPHFKQYYKGFLFRNAVVLDPSQFVPRLSTPRRGPCDFAQPLTLAEMNEQIKLSESKKSTQFILPTRPCVPVTY